MPKTPSRYIRANIFIERDLHKAAKKRAKLLGLRGGFSELLSRLLNRNLEQAGRDVMKMPRVFSAKRVCPTAVNGSPE